MTERVSVVIPARPDEPFLAEAVGSALAQPETDEVLVGCVSADSATGRWCAAHDDPRLRVVVSAGPSAGENLDAGVAATSAPWLAFLDADDRWPDGRLAAGFAALSATSDAELCRGRQQSIDRDGVALGEPVDSPLLGAVLVARSAAARIGVFGDDLVAPMRWLLRAEELGVPTVRTPAVVLHRREHGANLTATRRTDVHGAYLALARERVRRTKDSS